MPDTGKEKQYDNKGYSGEWSTTEKGEHYFIRDGETPEQAYFRHRQEQTSSALPDHLSVAEKVLSVTKNDKSENENKKNDISTQKGKSQKEFFGEEFKGIKGAAAVEKMLQEKRGHIKNAFERPEIGGIDLVWGDENGGLLHLIQKRDKLLKNGKGSISGQQMAKKIPEIIENGKFNQDEKGRLNIDYEKYRVGIMPTFYNNKINWIVTAMEKWQ